MITEEESRRLDEVQAQWRTLFGEEMPFGFDVTEGDLDVLEQCVRERSKRALNKLLKERSSHGRAY